MCELEVKYVNIRNQLYKYNTKKGQFGLKKNLMAIRNNSIVHKFCQLIIY